MSENLNLALQITLVGMTLVFVSLALFGVVMVILVRVTAERSTRATRAPELRARERELKARAAAAAVALALAQRHAGDGTRFPLPPTAIVSAWQAVTRANQLRRQGRIR